VVCVKSCAAANRPHPKKHGESGTKLYTAYKNMMARCYNEKADNFPYYGGRGITVCDEWKESKASFFKWSYKNSYSEGLSLDKINNDKGYSPENCRWVSLNVQSANQRIKVSNKSTEIGIHWHKLMCKWQAKIMFKGVENRLGYFENLEDAVECRRKYIVKHNLPHTL